MNVQTRKILKEQSFELKDKISLNLTDKKTQLLLVIFLTALYLRFQGLYYGLPYVLNPQEADNLVKIIAPLKWISKINAIHLPTVFTFLNTFVTYICSFTFDLNSILLRMEADSSSLLVPLRILSILFSIGSITLVYLICKIINPYSAIIAAGLLSVSLLHVKFSQVFMSYSGLTFLILLSTFYALKAYNSDKKSDYDLSLLFALVAASFNYFGLVAVISPVFSALFKGNIKYLKNNLKLFPIIFLVVNPFFVLDFIFSFSTYVKNYFNSFYYNKTSSYFLYSIDYLLCGMGPVAYFSALYLIKLKKQFNDHILKILFSVPVLYLAAIGLFHLSDIGYTVVLVPYVCVASGLVLGNLHNNTEYKFVYIVLLLFVFWIPLKYTLKYNKIMALADTRVIATNWIKEHTSDNVKIAWDKNSIQLNWHDAYSKSELKELVDETDLLISKQKFSITPDSLKRKDWFLQLRKKVDYVITDSLDYEVTKRQRADSQKKKYYKKLSKLKPLIAINPYLKDFDKKTNLSSIEDLYFPFNTLWERERAGPVIKIYKL